MNGTYFQDTCREYEKLRNHLFETLEKARFKPSKADGGYFIVAEIDLDEPEVCRYLTEHAGVTCIPVGAFYQEEDAHKVSKWARFAFCKDLATLQEARSRLENFSSNARDRTRN
jgi:aspartate/methionine/tyrosine aminotransferase